jgi:hypothetical protein
MSPVDFTKAGYFFTMGLAPNRIDILFDLKGLTFDAAWQRRVCEVVDNVNICFLYRVDLIINKEAVGRRIWRTWRNYELPKSEMRTSSH